MYFTEQYANFDRNCFTGKCTIQKIINVDSNHSITVDIEKKLPQRPNMVSII